MKRLVLLILILFSFNISFAQVKEQLSEKEKARREKNIQAGNPFKRFGYKPKIATLSKGKYLEFHDLDTIMRIGSFVFNTRQKKITGYVNLDTVHSEATLNPQLISRWFSPDPLSEEYPSWSPYNFTMNNPIFFVDPDGRYVDVSDYYQRKENETEEDFANRRKILDDLIADLSKLSGVRITVRQIGSTHMLWFDKNKKPTGDYSETLLNDLSSAIFDMSRIVSVYDSNNGSSGNNTRIDFDANESKRLSSNPTNVDPNTLGLGMSFMHELEHTDSGYDKKSGTSDIDVINRVNTMRKELNDKGKNYGQRQAHDAYSLGGFSSGTRIMPFNEKTRKELERNYYNQIPKGKNAQFFIIKKEKK